MQGFDIPGAVCGFLGMHLALRVEAGDLVRLVADGGQPALIRRRAELLTRVLHAHHTAEDRLL